MNTHLSFPIFQSDRREVMVGYGDWCGTEEGPHPGIDFYVDEENYVINPFDDTKYVLGSGWNTNHPEYGCILGLGEKDGHWGWALRHLDWSLQYENPSSWCSEPNNNRGSYYDPRDIIEACKDYSDVPRHLHIDWSFWIEDTGEPGGAYIPTDFHEYINPFDYFDLPSGYDQVSFKRVLYEEEFIELDRKRGIWFMPDGAETPTQISNKGADYYVFQDVISGAVDIAVSPYSQLLDYPNTKSNGVYSVGYEILYQNPQTLEFETIEASRGSFGYRQLFRADGHTPWDEEDEWDTLISIPEIDRELQTKAEHQHGSLAIFT
ncbi:MAG: hypothetical protein GF388_03990 [Candidatus Aegiribacteria sp.]|nr:hypothetical protein [Candidatus Aegiribacteria sp.]